MKKPKGFVQNVIKISKGKLFLANKIIGQGIGSGVSSSLRVAKKKAYSEAIERHTFVKLKPKVRNVSSNELKKLKQNHFPPSQFKLYLSDQISDQLLPIRNYRSDDRLDWVEYSEGQTKRKIFIPLEFTARKQGYSIPGFLYNSTGNAAHSSEQIAKTNALLETIERDAFVFMWRTKTPPIKINNWKKWMPKLNQIFEDYEFKLNPKFFLLKTDFQVFVVLGVQLKRSFVAVSAAADVDLSRAFFKAGIDLLQSSERMRIQNNRPKKYFDKTHRDLFAFSDRNSYFSSPDRKRQLNFILRTNDIKTFGEIHRTTINQRGTVLQFLFDELTRLKIRFFIYHTKKGVRNTQKFRHVIRIFSPDLLNIDYIHDYRMLGQPRYSELAKKLGRRKIFRRIKDFNNNPHPFS